MRTFVLRARAAPTDSQKLLAAVGQDAHPEILAHTLMNAIFVAQSHRPDVVVYLVLESTQDFSRTVRFEANAMHSIGGFDERALLGKVAAALDVASDGGTCEIFPTDRGAAWLVPPNDPRAIAAAVTALLDGPARRRRLQTAARARAEEAFALDRAARGLVAHYRALLGET